MSFILLHLQGSSKILISRLALVETKCSTLLKTSHQILKALAKELTFFSRRRFEMMVKYKDFKSFMSCCHVTKCVSSWWTHPAKLFFFSKKCTGAERLIRYRPCSAWTWVSTERKADKTIAEEESCWCHASKRYWQLHFSASIVCTPYPCQDPLRSELPCPWCFIGFIWIQGMSCFFF